MRPILFLCHVLANELDQKTAEELGVDIEQMQEQQPGVIESLREGFQGDKTQGQTEGSEQGNK